MKGAYFLLGVAFSIAFIASSVRLSAWADSSAAASAQPSSAQAASPRASTQAGVRIIYEDWQDSARNRSIPVKFYIPEKLSAPAPVVVFSHGLGGSREAAIYLGNHWAKHGYVCVFIQHPGSDESFWKPKFMTNGQVANRSQLLDEFKGTVKNPMHAVNRANDVHFVIDEVEHLNKSHPILKGKLDLDSIAIAGHSYGSWTALTASGQRLITPWGRDMSSPDPRIKAAVYLSPTSSRRNQDPAVVFGSINVPGLHFTGTLDDSPVNDSKAADRRVAFDNICRSDQYLITLNGADHMVFNGRPRARQKDLDVTHHAIIEKATTEFLDAYLKNDQAARAWLQKRAADELKSQGTYEMKIDGAKSI